MQKGQNQAAGPTRRAWEEATAVINAGTVQQNIRGFSGANNRGRIADLTSDQRTKAFPASNCIGLSVPRG